MQNIAPRFGLAVLALLLVLSTSPAAEEADPGTDPAETVRGMIDAINRRDLDALDAYVTADVVRHSAATPGIIVESLEQFEDFLRSDFAAVPDSKITVEHLISEGDLVAVHATYAGTQEGAMGPFPASGKPVSGPFLSFLRVEGGKIAEMWVEWDNLAMLTQLGHVPPPPSGADRAEKLFDAFEAAWAARDPKAIATLMTPTAVYEDVARSRSYVGPAAIEEFMRETFEWAPDFTVRTLVQATTHDVAVWEYVMEGTQTGPFPEASGPTEKPFSVPGLTILEFDGEGIRAVRDYYDRLEFRVQLGLMDE
jgi:steroid delta-isomerase-like uncharacterized protein/uncharacterized protein (TIGR02246 family)